MSSIEILYGIVDVFIKETSFLHFLSCHVFFCLSICSCIIFVKSNDYLKNPQFTGISTRYDVNLWPIYLRIEP